MPLGASRRYDSVVALQNPSPSPLENLLRRRGEGTIFRIGCVANVPLSQTFSQPLQTDFAHSFAAKIDKISPNRRLNAINAWVGWGNWVYC